MSKKLYQIGAKDWEVIDLKETISINGAEYPLELLQLIVSEATGKCTYEDCTNKAFARGLCNKHYRKMRSLRKIQIDETRKCSVSGCQAIHHAKGYCLNHYDEFVRRPRLVAEGKRRPK